MATTKTKIENTEALKDGRSVIVEVPSGTLYPGAVVCTNSDGTLHVVYCREDGEWTHAHTVPRPCVYTSFKQS